MRGKLSIRMGMVMGRKILKFPRLWLPSRIRVAQRYQAALELREQEQCLEAVKTREPRRYMRFTTGTKNCRKSTDRSSLTSTRRPS